MENKIRCPFEAHPGISSLLNITLMVNLYLEGATREEWQTA